eukprot:6291631-Pyramimonas_sp.AAC.1
MDRMCSILNDDDGAAEQEQKRQELSRQLVHCGLTLRGFMVYCCCGEIIDLTSKDTKSEDLASLYLRVHKGRGASGGAREEAALAGPRVLARHEQ